MTIQVVRQEMARRLQVECPKVYDLVKNLVNLGVPKRRILMVSAAGSSSDLMHFAVNCAVEELLADQVIEGVYVQTEVIQ